METEIGLRRREWRKKETERERESESNIERLKNSAEDSWRHCNENYGLASLY